jgi:broad specificity phosphatase PhoE
VPADLLHLVRHGEVDNPRGILYGRLPGYGLSDLGHRLADASAGSLAGRAVTGLFASPLQRTQESAAPWARRYGLDIQTDDRLIEPHNRFEGRRAKFGAGLLLEPRVWPWLRNPSTPSWGEPFVDVAARMMSVVGHAWNSVDAGEVVLVSHQMPIWMVARTVAGERLQHDPRKRRCSLSSITTLKRDGDRFVEVDYQEPGRELLAASVDFGAV